MLSEALMILSIAMNLTQSLFLWTRVKVRAKRCGENMFGLMNISTETLHSPGRSVRKFFYFLWSSIFKSGE